MRLRSLLIVVAGLLSALSAGQSVQELTLQLKTGVNGLRPENKLALELVNYNGDIVARGPVQVPDDGLAAGSDIACKVHLSQVVKWRTIYKAQLRLTADVVRGEWNLDSASLTNEDGTLEHSWLPKATLNRMDLSWRSPQLETFDASGLNTKVVEWSLLFNNGPDGMEGDSRAYMLFVWTNGASTRVQVTPEMTKGDHTTTLEMPADRVMSELAAAYLFFNDGNPLFGPQGSGTDRWMVMNARIQAKLIDEDVISRQFLKWRGDWLGQKVASSRYRNELNVNFLPEVEDEVLVCHVLWSTEGAQVQSAKASLTFGDSGQQIELNLATDHTGALTWTSGYHSFQSQTQPFADGIAAFNGNLQISVESGGSPIKIHGVILAIKNKSDRNESDILNGSRILFANIDTTLTGNQFTIPIKFTIKR